MFDFDFTKLLVVGVLALIFIPPKDLPRVLRQLGQGYGKLQRLASDFRRQITEALEEADIDSVKREFTEFTDPAKFDFDAPPPVIAPDVLLAAPEPTILDPAKKRKPRQARPKPEADEASVVAPKTARVAAIKKPARAPRKIARIADEPPVVVAAPEMPQVEKAAE